MSEFYNDVKSFLSTQPKAILRDLMQGEDGLTDCPFVVTSVAEHGGEGQGDEFWHVYKFEQADKSCLIKFDGWYSSYDGAEYSDYFEVEPKQKVITVYETP